MGLERRAVPHGDAVAAMTPCGRGTSLPVLCALPSMGGAPSFPSLAAGSHPTCDSARQYLHSALIRALQEHPINAPLRRPRRRVNYRPPATLWPFGVGGSALGPSSPILAGRGAAVPYPRASWHRARRYESRRWPPPLPRGRLQRLAAACGTGAVPGGVHRDGGGVGGGRVGGMSSRCGGPAPHLRRETRPRRPPRPAPPLQHHGERNRERGAGCGRGRCGAPGEVRGVSGHRSDASSGGTAPGSGAVRTRRPPQPRTPRPRPVRARR